MKILLNFAASVDPDVNMKGCEDFFLTVLHAHIIAAARKVTQKQQYKNVKDLANEILCQFAR